MLANVALGSADFVERIAMFRSHVAEHAFGRFVVCSFKFKVTLVMACLSSFDKQFMSSTRRPFPSWCSLAERVRQLTTVSM